MGAGNCTPAWTSAYGYIQALHAARRKTWQRATPAADFLLVDLVATAAGEGHFEPSYVVWTRPREPLGPVSDVTVDLLGADGRILSQHRLHQLSQPPADRTFPVRFVEAIRWHPDTRALRAHHRGRFMAETRLRPWHHDSEVEFELDGRVATVSWVDPGADASTRFMVRFSNDNAVNWYALAADESEPSIELNLAGLPTGSQCLFQVLSSDVSDPRHARSVTFRRDPGPLELKILSPEEPVGRRHSSGAPLKLSAAPSPRSRGRSGRIHSLDSGMRGRPGIELRRPASHGPSFQAGRGTMHDPYGGAERR